MEKFSISPQLSYMESWNSPTWQFFLIRDIRDKYQVCERSALEIYVWISISTYWEKFQETDHFQVSWQVDLKKKNDGPSKRVRQTLKNYAFVEKSNMAYISVVRKADTGIAKPISPLLYIDYRSQPSI